MNLMFFPTGAEFYQWLATNHDKVDELWVGYYKKHTGIPSITWPESVDQALCFGWIDGIRKRIDEQSYKVRFTPRRPKSMWSAVNIKRVEELKTEGLMMPAGLAAYEKREEKKSKVYSYERKNAKLSDEYEAQIRANEKAWDYYEQRLAHSYKKASIHWIMSAKKEETRQRRLNILIQSCEEGQKIPPLRRN